MGLLIIRKGLELMKGKIILLSVFFVGLSALGGIKYFTTFFDDKSSAKVVSSENVWIADFNDKRKLVGESDNVFIGEVIKQVGEEDLTGKPNTQFTVKVLTNIKGNLEGTVTVNQEAGYYKENGELYLLLTEGDELLIPNETYLFTSNVIEEKGWHHLTAGYGTLTIKAKEDKIKNENEFKDAFKNQIKRFN
jgi:hypothetical protein